MRTGITLQRLHGATDFQVVTGPEVSIQTQLDAAKALAREHGRAHPEVAEVQIWTSSEGLRKRYKFQPGATPSGSDEKDAGEDAEDAGDPATTGKGRRKKKSAA